MTDRPASISREERVALIERLRAGIKPLDDLPPSIQSQANIRLINAVNDAIAALSVDERLIEALDALEAENEGRTERARTDRELGVAGGVALTLRQIRQRIGADQ